jgi:hypothetical protein
MADFFMLVMYSVMLLNSLSCRLHGILYIGDQVIVKKEEFQFSLSNMHAIPSPLC